MKSWVWIPNLSMTELFTLLMLMVSWRAVADGAVEGFTRMEIDKHR
jgi:hypothetical protein